MRRTDGGEEAVAQQHAVHPVGKKAAREEGEDSDAAGEGKGEKGARTS